LPFRENVFAVLLNISHTQFYLLDNIKNIYLFLLIFVSFEELFCFTKTIISQPLNIYVDI